MQLSVATMLLLVACVAFNLWLFKLGPLLGIIGLNITKHVVIAWLCQVLGVDRRRNRAAARPFGHGETAPSVNPGLIPPPPHTP
ncbi:MAG: hypothetical protein P4L84_35710 [Isosphaeraceae bacterium]|nr:hypothetical protein [Isosphaeraceae bacterium]